MMTAFVEVQTAVQAIKLGATDYLQKPIDCATVRKEIEQLVVRGSQRRAAARETIVGHSAAIRRVWRLAEPSADANRRAVHQRDRRPAASGGGRRAFAGRPLSPGEWRHHQAPAAQRSRG